MLDLPGRDEVAENGKRLLDRRLLVRRMALVEVDRVDLKATQAVLDGAGDVGAAEPFAVRPLPHAAADLRRHDEVIAVATLLHPAADDLL